MSGVWLLRRRSGGGTTLVLAGTLAAVGTLAVASAQQRPPAPSRPGLVFDGVTVVDVEHGRLLPAQRVVIAGNRIQAVGQVDAVKIPQGAQVVEARGKYLSPGLWDMHVHAFDTAYVYAPFLAYGVTGVRDMGTPALAQIQHWRREIVAGTRLGPRIVAAGPYVGSSAETAGGVAGLRVATPADGRRVVDSLQAAGADFIKVRDGYFEPEDNLSRATYFAVVAEARRVGLPIAGHPPTTVSMAEASDSGQRSFEHGSMCSGTEAYPCVPELCLGLAGQAAPDSVVGPACTALAARLRHNGTWFTPTLMFMREAGDTRPPWFLWLTTRAWRFGIPLLAGTDTQLTGESPPAAAAKVQTELVLLGTAGLPPLDALRAATLNPAQYFQATDSLGTVAVGKLADLVLLDADPLADIAHTAAVRAVVANGRYYDRAALDRLRGDAEQATPAARVAPPGP